MRNLRGVRDAKLLQPVEVMLPSGGTRLAEWLAYERDIVADYRRAFGEEPPPIAGVALTARIERTALISF